MRRDAAPQEASPSWTRRKERGTRLGLRFILACLRLFGRTAAGVVCDVVVAYYFAASAAARRSSRRYLERVAAFPAGRAALGRAPDTWASWLHFRSYAHGLLDRACFWGGMSARFRVTFERRARLDELQAAGRGAVLLGAHLGSFDVLRALASKKRYPVHTLVFEAAAVKFQAFLRELDPQLDVRAIHVEPGSIQYVLDLKACIDRGEFVALLGDRAELVQHKRTAQVSFLGAAATFPLGPILLAHSLQCPVVLLFALRTGPRDYTIVLEEFSERIELDPRQRERDARAWLMRYVARLEAHCCAHPLQWSNFHDFWRDDAPPRAATNEHAGRELGAESST